MENNYHSDATAWLAQYGETPVSFRFAGYDRLLAALAWLQNRRAVFVLEALPGGEFSIGASSVTIQLLFDHLNAWAAGAQPLAKSEEAL